MSELQETEQCGRRVESACGQASRKCPVHIENIDREVVWNVL